MDQISTVSQTTGVPLSWFLMVSAILFCLGFIGVLTRRNVLVIFMSAELMMNAVNLSLIAFSTSLNSMAGQNFVVFVVTIAAAEAAVGSGNHYLPGAAEAHRRYYRHRLDARVEIRQSWFPVPEPYFLGGVDARFLSKYRLACAAAAAVGHRHQRASSGRRLGARRRLDRHRSGVPGLPDGAVGSL